MIGVIFKFFFRNRIRENFCSNPVGKIANKQSEGARFLLIRPSKYSAMLSKIHSYRLLFRRFCPMGSMVCCLYIFTELFIL